jgi:ABC-type lipoprotein export system ATPase subunit
MRLRIRELRKKYTAPSGQIAALDNIDLQLAAGEFVALRGKSGCGKSTLLLTIGGLLRPDHGKVLVDDHDFYEMSPNARAIFRARHIGFVFQQFHLVPYLSVLDNVLSASLGLSPRERDKNTPRAAELIEQLGLTSRIQHLPGELSTGEKQRVALARALLNDPVLILADEPTGNLDPENATAVLQALRAYATRGGTVLLVTHDDQAAGAADRVWMMESGRLARG